MNTLRRPQSAALRSASIVAVVAVALLTPFVLAVWSHQNQRPAVTLAAAQAWLTTSGTGQVSLVDGPSATFVAAASFGGKNTALSVVDRGNTAFALDPLNHSLITLDAATEQQSTVRTTGTSLDGAQPLVSGDTLYLHRADNTVASLPPQHATLVAGPDLSSSHLSTNTRLAATGGMPAAVDLEGGTVTWFNGSSPSGHADVGGTLDPGTLVAGDQETGDVFLLDPQRRTLVACRQRSATCEPAASLAPGTKPLGQPVVAAGRVIVPDPNTGSVLVLSAQSTTDTATPLNVFPAGTAFELVEQQGYVFANDPSSPTAKVIAPDNSIRPVPKHPAGPTTTAAPTTRPPTPRPSHSTSRPTTRPPRSTPTSRPTHRPQPSRALKPTATPKPTRTYKPAPPHFAHPVSLSVEGKHGRTITVAATIHEPPATGRTYFLLLKVDQGGEDGIQYFARWRMKGLPIGKSVSHDLYFVASADLTRPRTMFVVSANAADSQMLWSAIQQNQTTNVKLPYVPCCTVSLPVHLTP